LTPTRSAPHDIPLDKEEFRLAPLLIPSSRQLVPVPAALEERFRWDVPPIRRENPAKPCM